MTSSSRTQNTLLAFIFAVSCVFLDSAFAQNESPTTTSDDASKPIKLTTEPCDLTREQATIGSIADALSQKKEKLTRRCTINVQDTDVHIYLPKQDSYSIENTSDDDTVFGNNSVYISIDQDRDGTLSSSEAMPTNLPIRILDTMYQVTEIAQDGSSISLKQLDMPLFGTVLNRICPQFSLQTLDGKTITDKSILGKVTILDIWAVT